MVLLLAAAKLYLPKVNRSSGAAIDMWIKVSLPLSLSPYVCACEFMRQLVYMLMPMSCLLPQAKELESNTEYYLELLAKGIGKPQEEIEKDIQRPKYFRAQEAIDYGIADKIIDSQDSAFEKRVTFMKFYFIYGLYFLLGLRFNTHKTRHCFQNYEELLAQSKAMRRAAGAGPQAAPTGFR